MESFFDFEQLIRPLKESSIPPLPQRNRASRIKNYILTLNFFEIEMRIPLAMKLKNRFKIFPQIFYIFLSHRLTKI